ncbi:hypothetical protein E2C01_004823 [Portunus trituberculatus]|uniref:Uncharacterized protein n=1 Tax=Portunus trituberculatus TaxID=210409 RepID=A0A5B7CSD7_PORTR|nr:hypothetical protein [Portunus trituberculatus]
MGAAGSRKWAWRLMVRPPTINAHASRALGGAWRANREPKSVRAEIASPSPYVPDPRTTSTTTRPARSLPTHHTRSRAWL